MTPAQREGWRRLGWVAALGWIVLAGAVELGGSDRPRDIVLTVLVPPLAVWVVLAAVRWVRAGFRGE